MFVSSGNHPENKYAPIIPDIKAPDTEHSRIFNFEYSFTATRIATDIYDQRTQNARDICE